MKNMLVQQDEACKALLAGKLLIYPTETFYALGCDAFNAESVGAIFALKKRQMSLPLPVVISRTDQLSKLVRFIPPLAEKLMQLFWPGPLSIVLPARPEVPDLLTAGAGRIAVRQSPHPVVQILSDVLDMVLVASSANVSGNPPACLFESLDAALVAETAGVYNLAPEPSGGMPSTIVDVVRVKQGEVVRVLREGAVSLAMLRGAGIPLGLIR